MGARVQQINEMIRSHRTDASVTDALGSPVINDLRSKYLRASKLAAELSAQLGSDHSQVINLREEMAQYERLFFKELEHISQAYASDLEVARARENSLNEFMLSLIGRKLPPTKLWFPSVSLSARQMYSKIFTRVFSKDIRTPYKDSRFRIRKRA